MIRNAVTSRVCFNLIFNYTQIKVEVIYGSVKCDGTFVVRMALQQ